MKNSKRMRNAAVYSGKKPNGSSNANIRKHSKFRKQDYIKEKSEPYSAEDMVKALEEVAAESGAVPWCRGWSGLRHSASEP